MMYISLWNKFFFPKIWWWKEAETSGFFEDFQKEILRIYEKIMIHLRELEKVFYRVHSFRKQILFFEAFEK